jgi:hypothetical protein
MDPMDAVAAADLLQPKLDWTARVDTTDRLLRAVQGAGASPEIVLGSALVELLRHLLRDELQARVTAGDAEPRSPWVTPPIAARLTRVQVKTIRAWARTRRITKRLENRPVDPKQQKYLVNVDDIVAVAEQAAGAPVETSDSGRAPAAGAGERGTGTHRAHLEREVADGDRVPALAEQLLVEVPDRRRRIRASRLELDRGRGRGQGHPDEVRRRARAAAGLRAPAGSLTFERFFNETWLPLRQKIRPWRDNGQPLVSLPPLPAPTAELVVTVRAGAQRLTRRRSQPSMERAAVDQVSALRWKAA